MEIIYLYCAFSYLFAFSSIVSSDHYTANSIFALIIAPVALPIILGQKF